MKLIIRPKRLKFLKLLAISTGFVVLGAFLIREGEPIGWATVLFFGVGIIVFSLMLLPGSAYLKLDRDGFTICSLYRSHSARWDEVERFEVGSFKGRKMVFFNFSNSHRGREFLRKLSSAIAGYEAALRPEIYGLSAEQFAALMNDWREHRGPSTACD